MPSRDFLEMNLPNEKAMLEFAGCLAIGFSPPLVVFLCGQLGAGKTTLVRGLLRGLGYQGRVKSPSYNVVEPYELKGRSVFHFDFYRIQDPRELDFIGFQDYWQPSAIFLIEWPEKAASLLPPADLSCYLEVWGEGRKIKLKAETERGRKILAAV